MKRPLMNQPALQMFQPKMIQMPPISPSPLPPKRKPLVPPVKKSQPSEQPKK